MTTALVLVFLAAALAPAVVRRIPARAGLVLAALPALLAVGFATRVPAVAGGEVGLERHPWVPALGIEAAFRLDGLSVLMALLVTGVGALVVLYAHGYAAESPGRGRLLALLLAFMGAMLGLVLADDLFVLFVFWELTTITSFLLVGFQSERLEARKAALQSLLVTGAGGLALLAGLLVLASAAGTSSISALLAQGPALRAHPAYPAIVALVAAGAFTKSAQVPFHFWLPGAMQAPTPVSAYLHSSTMVKAGVYLLARLSPALGGSDLWMALLVGFGAATLLTGGVMALGQSDLKRILAFSTVGVLGLLTLLLGLGTPIAARAFAVTLLAHAFYKGTLFLVAGNVDHATGTRDVDRLGGLGGVMPRSAAAAAVAAVSMAGAPPLFGFLAKETAYEAALEAPVGALWLGPAVVAMGVCLVFAAARVALQVFGGTRRGTPRVAHEVPTGMWVGPVALAAMGLTAGLLAGPAERLLVAPAARAVLQEGVPTGLALWHGFTPILALSVFTLAAGALLFRLRAGVLWAAAALRPLARVGPAAAWEAGLAATLRFAAWQTRVLQSGSLRRSLLVTLATAFAVVGAALLRGPFPGSAGPAFDVRPQEAAAVLLAALGAGMAVRATTRMAAVAALGAVGFGVALLFLLFGAPDLALTQIVIEVLTVILLLLVLRRLPDPAPSRRHRRSDALVAVGGGVLMAVLTLLAAELQLAEPVSHFFGDQSLPAGHGRNVVNVILVDFRALDTLGEATVLAAAGIGILALLRGSRSPRPEEDAP